jgi:hypothetical protein
MNEDCRVCDSALGPLGSGRVFVALGSSHRRDGREPAAEA